MTVRAGSSPSPPAFARFLIPVTAGRASLRCPLRLVPCPFPRLMPRVPCPCPVIASAGSTSVRPTPDPDCTALPEEHGAHHQDPRRRLDSRRGAGAPSPSRCSSRRPARQPTSRSTTRTPNSPRRWAAVTAHPDLAKIVSLGKTRGGRDIWAVELAQPRGVPVDERPALLVAANFEGDHLDRQRDSRSVDRRVPAERLRHRRHHQAAPRQSRHLRRASREPRRRRADVRAGQERRRAPTSRPTTPTTTRVWTKTVPTT